MNKILLADEKNGIQYEFIRYSNGSIVLGVTASDFGEGSFVVNGSNMAQCLHKLKSLRTALEEAEKNMAKQIHGGICVL